MRFAIALAFVIGATACGSNNPPPDTGGGIGRPDGGPGMGDDAGIGEPTPPAEEDGGPFTGGPVDGGEEPPDGGDSPFQPTPTGDGGSMSCRDISAAYAAALETAKACNTEAPNQCQEQLPLIVGCPCQTYVESTSAGEARQLAKQWQDSGCTRSCPEPPCPAITAGNCKESFCEDITQ